MDDREEKGRVETLTLICQWLIKDCCSIVFRPIDARQKLRQGTTKLIRLLGVEHSCASIIEPLSELRPGLQSSQRREAGEEVVPVAIMISSFP